MTIHWSLFLPGVLLLLFPADRLLSSRIELRSFGCFQSLENSPRYRPWWWVPVLWVDPIRALLGAFLLQHALELETMTPDFTGQAGYGLLLGTLALAVMCQTFTSRGNPAVLLAPMGFVSGLVAALTPWPVALIAIVTAVLGLFAFRQFHAFFGTGFAAVALLGFVLKADVEWIAPAVGAFALPIATGFLTGRALELPTRNSSKPPA